MQFLSTLNGLLEHIKSVQNEAISMTQEAQLRMVRFVEKQGLILDDETLEAMQYQDIISQQLNATIEAIESAQTHLQYFSRALSEDDFIAAQSIEKMHEKLSSALERAQQKHSAFSGRVNNAEDDGVEFF